MLVTHPSTSSSCRSHSKASLCRLQEWPASLWRAWWRGRLSKMPEGWSSMMKRTSDGQAVSAEHPFFVCFAILVNYKLKHRGKSLLVASDGLNGLGILNDWYTEMRLHLFNSLHRDGWSSPFNQIAIIITLDCYGRRIVGVLRTLIIANCSSWEEKL